MTAVVPGWQKTIANRPVFVIGAILTSDYSMYNLIGVLNQEIRSTLKGAPNCFRMCKEVDDNNLQHRLSFVNLLPNWTRINDYKTSRSTLTTSLSCIVNGFDVFFEIRSAVTSCKGSDIIIGHKNVKQLIYCRLFNSLYAWRLWIQGFHFL